MAAVTALALSRPPARAELQALPDEGHRDGPVRVGLPFPLEVVPVELRDEP